MVVKNQMSENNEMTKRERQILEWIRQNPMISQNEIADLAGISRSGAAAHVSNLIKKGYLRGKGYVLAPQKYVVVIGGMNIDTYGIATHDFQIKTSNPGHVVHAIGGLGRNISLNLHKLAVTNYFITAYGDDFWGEQFLADSADQGLDVSYSKKFSNSATSNYIYLNQPNGERFIGLDDMEINKRITPEFIKDRSDIIMAANYLVLDTNLPEETIGWLTENYQGAIFAKAVSVTKTQRLKSVLSRLDTLVINGIETPILAGIRPTDRDTAEQAARKLLAAGVNNVFIYVDNVGTVYANSTAISFFPAPDVQTINTNGDGAAATAALVYARIHDQVQIAGELASAATALTATSEHAVSEEMSVDRLTKIAVKLNSK